MQTNFRVKNLQHIDCYRPLPIDADVFRVVLHLVKIKYGWVPTTPGPTGHGAPGAFLASVTYWQLGSIY